MDSNPPIPCSEADDLPAKIQIVAWWDRPLLSMVCVDSSSLAGKSSASERGMRGFGSKHDRFFLKVEKGSKVLDFPA